MFERRVFGGVFKPRLGPALFTIFGVAVMLTLGCWQVQRREWKHEIIHKVETRIKATPVTLPTDSAAFAESDKWDFVPAKIAGTFDHDHEFHMLGINSHGTSGYFILTPFRTEPQGVHILVNRGFVNNDHKKPETRRAGQLVGISDVSGIVTSIEPRGRFTPENDAKNNIWLYVDLPRMAAVAHVDAFLPVILEADAKENVGGWPVGGQTKVTFTDNHLVYAITWFSMAFALIVIFFLAHWQKDEA